MYILNSTSWVIKANNQENLFVG